jgi:uncharacterized protein (TIGR02300 family)
MDTMTAAQSKRAARGTKRVCQACETRFYDLLRVPIMCPSCGAEYTPAAQSPVGQRKTAVARTGWRQAAVTPAFIESTLDSPSTGNPGTAAEQEIEGAGDDTEDRLLIEQEGDDPDFTGLVEIDPGDPKDR